MILGFTLKDFGIILRRKSKSIFREGKYVV